MQGGPPIPDLPDSVHRLLLATRVEDEVVAVTNARAIAGLAVLSLSMIGAVPLVADWAGGAAVGAGFAIAAAVVFGTVWFAFPLWLRARGREGVEEVGDRSGR